MSRVALVTGGAQGIGRAISYKLVRDGYRVSIADIHREAGAETVRYIHKLGGEAMFMNVDISEEAQVAKWIQLTTEQFGAIHALVNNAGIGRGGSMLTLPISDFDRVWSVNVRGTFLCSRHAAKVMIQSGGGSIVNIASTRALMSEADTEAYSASKGAVLALTHAMAISLGPHKIRVNAISPGWIETSDWQYSPNAAQPYHSERDRLQHPVGRVGHPNDIAEACAYLLSDKSGFITGQNLVIDGGMTVKMIYE
jgi:NAD(P)-dependent dehydrogenase (short-subunit alcohol dehydrogenase family)